MLHMVNCSLNHIFDDIQLKLGSEVKPCIICILSGVI